MAELELFVSLEDPRVNLKEIAPSLKLYQKFTAVKYFEQLPWSRTLHHKLCKYIYCNHAGEKPLTVIVLIHEYLRFV